MIQFEAPISPWLIAAWLIATAAGAVLIYRRQRRVLRPTYLGGLISLRCVSAVLLATLLLHPFIRTESPDTEEFRILLLTDSSGSMQTRDCVRQQARITIAESALDGASDKSLLSRLRRRYSVDSFIFSEGLHRHTGSELPVLPGMTALGASLNQALAEYGHRAGAIVLLSDGQSNTGESFPEAAKAAARAGIPVTCVGIGEHDAVEDLRLTAPPKAVSAVKREPTTVPVTVSSTYKAAQEATVSLYRGEMLLQQRKISMPEGPAARDAVFEITPFEAGVQTYRVRVESPGLDVRPENDTAYIAVEAAEPPVYRVLYLGGQLSWGYRFLKRLADRSEQIDLMSIIRVADDVYHKAGDLPPELEELDGFPQDLDDFRTFDVIVIDPLAPTLLSESAIASIGQFAGARGGGILAAGPVDALPQAMIEYLPVSLTEARTVRRHTFLEVQSGLIFSETDSASLLTPPGPYLPDGEAVQVARTLKPAARAILATAAEGDPVLAAQLYGGGRTAYLGTDATWRWYLASDEDHERYEAFWSHLLVWLGASGKPRVAPQFAGKQLAVNESTQLQVAVLGPDFRPAVHANVHLTLKGPEGELVDLPMSLSADTPGVYTAWYTPMAAGEFQANVRVALPDEPVLQQETYFLGVHGGAEYRDVEYQEQVLRDVARITGGAFVHYRDINELDDLELSGRVPMKPKQSFWTNSWLFVLLLLGSILAEWYMRRRIGLK